MPEPQYTYVDIDPVTKKPLQAAQPQPQQIQPQQNQPQQFDVEKFAADSANRQMMFAYQRGLHPTMQDFEDARKAAYQQGFETMRQMQLDTMRQQAELQRQMQMHTFEQFGPRTMSPEEVKDASGLLNAHNQIMMLYHQNQDIPENDMYRTVGVGDVSGKVQQMTDPRVRLYEATRGGSVIALGRGLLQDTGQVAGKDEAQALIRQLMPGPGDSSLMSARKTADMIQMEMNGLQAKIQGLPGNVDATPLKQAYANAYNDYATLVNQFGSDAQKNFPVPSPQQLWGQTTPAATVTVNPVQPAVKAGVSQATSDTLNAQAAGKAPLANQPGYTDIDPQTKQPLGGTVWRPPTGVPPAASPTQPTYPTIASEGTPYGTTPQQQPSGVVGWATQDMPGQLQKTLQALTPKPGGPSQDLTMPAGSVGPTTWGQ